MDPEMRASIDRLARDARSGASELVPAALAILRSALPGGRGRLVEGARAVCRAQPAMGPLWNAAAAALADERCPGRLDAFERRWRRAGPALCRVSVEALRPREAGSPVHLTTCSFSGSVLAAATALAGLGPLTVACAEGRPRLEGRRMAGALAAAGVAVELYTDAGLAGALPRTSALVVGADAVTAGWFLNKCGTWMLAAAAAASGVPVYVVASRDKFVPEALARLLLVRPEPAAEVWDAPPPGVAVRNAYFERVPMGLVAALVTDAGVIGADMAGEVCRANGEALDVADVEGLAGPGAPAAA